MSESIHCPECDAPLRVRDGMAGKKVKCPRCAKVVVVPDAAEESAEEAITEVQPLPKKKKAAEPATRRCPECDKKVPADATKCRFCKAVLDTDEPEEDEEETSTKKIRYKPCPECGAKGAKRVKWTAWGSFYGPTLFNHVECPECEYRYNGKTGRSNGVAIFFFILIPSLAILGVLALMGYIILKRMDMWPPW